jgi:hypothetical protein
VETDFIIFPARTHQEDYNASSVGNGTTMN